MLAMGTEHGCCSDGEVSWLLLLDEGVALLCIKVKPCPWVWKNGTTRGVRTSSMYRCAVMFPPPPRTGTSCVLKFSYSPLHHDVAPTKVKNLLRCTYEHILHVCIPWSHHHTFPSQMWNGLRKWQIFTAPAVIWRAHLPIEVCSGRGLTEGVGQAGMDVFIPSDDVNSFQRSVSVR